MYEILNNRRSSMEISRYHLSLLRKMWKQNLIGKNYKYENAILSGFPSHDKKNLRRALEDLAKIGLVGRYPKAHGIKYSLNPRRLSEIREALKEQD
jgi:hypothetical protein